MWFKNIQVYKLDGVEKRTEEDLEKMLLTNKFEACKPTELVKTGWDFIYKDDAENKLTRKVGQSFFFNLKTECKIIPSNVVKDKLEERIKEVSKQNDGKKLNKDEKNDLKDAIILKMAQTAFSKNSNVFSYVDFKNNFFVVETSSAKKAEEVIGYLRTTLGGSFNVTPVVISERVPDIITGFVSQNMKMQKFEFLQNFDLKDLNGSKISFKNHDIVDCLEVKNHLDKGHKIIRQDMLWQKRIKFSLNEKSEIRSIKPEDHVKQSLKESLGESNDYHNEFQVSMLMMTEDYAEIVNDLIELLKK